MIVKISRRDNPYAQIDRAVLRDTRLSWRARGLLCYCLSLPRNDIVTVAGLVAQSPAGDQVVQSGLHELSEYGYAELEATRNALGQVVGRHWTIYERPIKQPTDKPVSGLSA